MDGSQSLELQGPLLYSDEWDVLIIMDTCRFDYFKEALPYYDWPGNLKCVDSESGCTDDWYKKHFITN